MNEELIKEVLGKGEIYAFNMGIRFAEQRIIKLLEQDYFHDIQFESITLQAGMEPNWVRKHGANCLACPAIALIKGENK